MLFYVIFMLFVVIFMLLLSYSSIFSIHFFDFISGRERLFLKKIGFKVLLILILFIC